MNNTEEVKPNLDDLTKNIYEKKLKQIKEEQTLPEKKFFIKFFIYVAYIFFGMAALVLILCFLKSIFLLCKDVILNFFSDKIDFTNNFIKALQPIITGFAISQLFVVSAVTALDLKLMWNISIHETDGSDSRKEEPLLQNRTKTGIILELVISTILLTFIIIYNNLLDYTGKNLDKNYNILLKVSYLLIGSAAIFLIFRSIQYVIFERKYFTKR
jgi:hypothetical protein